MRNFFVLLAMALLLSSASAQNAITTDSILQTSTCAGGNVLIPFTATGSYPWGNSFIAQLSNNFGQFTNPVDIGQIPFNLGFILGTIPQNTNFGFLYKIRVISTNPAVTGTPCPNILIITQVAQLNQIYANPDDTICQGDTALLAAMNPASSYHWSTGDTSQYITVTQPGTYSVTTTDILHCESSTSLTLTVVDCSIGMDEKAAGHTVSVFPNPAFEKIAFKYLPAEVRAHYRILTSLGRVVKEGFILDGEVGIAELSRGMYFILITSGEKNYRGRFIRE